MRFMTLYRYYRFIGMSFVDSVKTAYQLRHKGR
jgi:hypothetical protein